MCGAGTQTATSSSTLPEWALPGAQALVSRGLTESTAPWANTGGMTPAQLTAMGLPAGATSTRGFTTDQLSSMQGVRNAQGAWQPAMNNALTATGQAGALSSMAASAPYMDAAGNWANAAGRENGLTAMSPYMDAAGNWANAAGNIHAVNNISPYLSKSMETGALDTARPYIDAAGVGANTTVGNYMNPYNAAVTDRLGVLAGRNLSENLLPAVNNTFIGAGMFGSDRSADFTNRAIRDTQDSLLGAQGNVLQSGYQGALGAAQTDLARQAQLAGVAGGLADSDAARALQAGTLGLNATQADINKNLAVGAAQSNLGNMALAGTQSNINKNLAVGAAQSNLGSLAQAGTNADRAGLLAVGQQYGALGQQQQQQSLQDASSLMATGNQQQQQNLGQTNFNWDQLARLGSIMQGTPMPMTTTQTSPGPSIWSQLGGAALAGYGMFRGYKDGGRTPKRFAQGGRGVLGLLDDTPEDDLRRYAAGIPGFTDPGMEDEARKLLETASAPTIAPTIAPRTVEPLPEPKPLRDDEEETGALSSMGVVPAVALGQSPLSTPEWQSMIDEKTAPGKKANSSSMVGPLSDAVKRVKDFISPPAAPEVANSYGIPKRPSWDNPFTTAGFAMMASRNPSPLGALGEAGLAGVGSEAGRRKEDWNALSTMSGIEVARRGPVSPEVTLARSLGFDLKTADGQKAFNAFKRSGAAPPAMAAEAELLGLDLRIPDQRQQYVEFKSDLKGSEFERRLRTLGIDPDDTEGVKAAIEAGLLPSNRRPGAGAGGAGLSPAQRTAIWNNAQVRAQQEVKLQQEVSGVNYTPEQIREMTTQRAKSIFDAGVAAASVAPSAPSGPLSPAPAAAPAPMPAPMQGPAPLPPPAPGPVSARPPMPPVAPAPPPTLPRQQGPTQVGTVLQPNPAAPAAPMPPPALAPTLSPLPTLPTLPTLPVPAGQPKLTPAQKAGQKETGTILAKGIADIRDADTAARKSDFNNDRLASLLKDVETGKFAETGLEVKKAITGLFGEAGREFITAMGIPDTVGKEEAARALAADMALQLRNPAGGAGMPGALSDQDRNFLQSMVPGLSITPAGRKLIIDYTKAVNARTKAVAKRAWDYVRKHGALDATFHAELAEWSDANRLFVEPPPDAENWKSQTHRTLGVGWVSPDGKQFIPAPKV